MSASEDLVISVAVMSPAASIFFNTIPQAGFVGAAIPLCYVIGFLLALLIANQYSEFSREIPSSGSAIFIRLDQLIAEPPHTRLKASTDHFWRLHHREEGE